MAAVLGPFHVVEIELTKLHLTKGRTPKVRSTHLIGRERLALERVLVEEHFFQLTLKRGVLEDTPLEVDLCEPCICESATHEVGRDVGRVTQVRLVEHDAFEPVAPPLLDAAERRAAKVHGLKHAIDDDR